jgi:ribosomal protein S18 acetylase RimI-like enzyme
MEPITSTPRHIRRSLRVRAAREADLPELARIDQELFAPADYPYFVLRQLFDIHGRHLLVLTDGDRVHGYAWLAADQTADFGWILGLGVDEFCRRQGHGRRLLTSSMSQAAAAGLREVRLTVEPENDPAIRLYSSLGFMARGCRRDYFGPGADRLTMSAALHG